MEAAAGKQETWRALREEARGQPRGGRCAQAAEGLQGEARGTGRRMGGWQAGATVQGREEGGGKKRSCSSLAEVGDLTGNSPVVRWSQRDSKT